MTAFALGAALLGRRRHLLESIVYGDSPVLRDV